MTELLWRVARDAGNGACCLAEMIDKGTFSVSGPDGTSVTHRGGFVWCEAWVSAPSVDEAVMKAKALWRERYGIGTPDHVGNPCVH